MITTGPQPVAAPLCRICAAPLTETFVDLGMSPPCESFLTADQLDAAEAHLSRCTCASARRACSSSYRPITSPRRTSSAEYAYFSSFSDSWVEHARSLRRG